MVLSLDDGYQVGALLSKLGVTIEKPAMGGSPLCRKPSEFGHLRPFAKQKCRLAARPVPAPKPPLQKSPRPWSTTTGCWTVRRGGLTFWLNSESNALIATVTPDAAVRPINETSLREQLAGLGYGNFRYHNVGTVPVHIHRIRVGL
jgi:hypothetical protein